MCVCSYMYAALCRIHSVGLYLPVCCGLSDILGVIVPAAILRYVRYTECSSLPVGILRYIR